MNDFKCIVQRSVVRFLIVGGLSTSIDFIIYIILRESIGSNFGKLFSMICAMIFSFLMNKRWTFRSKDNNSLRIITLFIFVQILNIFINVSTNFVMLKLTNMVVLSFIIATSAATIINFIGQKFLVFQK